MVSYRRQLTVPGSVEETFDYVSRFSSTAEWDPGVSSATAETPDPVGLGSKFAVTAVFLGREVPLEYEITEFDRPHRVVLMAENRSARSADTIVFRSDSPDRTVIDYNADLTLRGLARVATPIVAVAFRRIGDRAAEGLLATLSAKVS